MTQQLTGKVAIVTGSGRGLGLAYAQELARHGASVVINDVDQAVADEAVASIVAAGGSATAVVAPVGTAEVAAKLVARAVEAFGRLDILVTNAGVLRDKSILKMTDDDFDTVIGVHLRGTFTCVREAFGHFKENGVAGRIIAIGSPTGQRGNFGQTNYAAAKAGIVGMVRTWSLEMKRSGVTVNAVIPVAATAMTRTVPYFAAAIDAEDRGEPMPDFYRKELGFGTSADVAPVVAFLATDVAASVTGQVIGVGGDRVQVWTHPEAIVTEYHNGGWSLEALEADFAPVLAANLQTVGDEFPALPTELQPEKVG
ncbi:dehydrogenase [Subtercola boreus]|uniref:Dehydrogenase n=1 Tax=Subtercola boreus TaxID=120213 RepID=A0A3E0VI81_9MICO|nr:SDR family NAD(P)-dependent oxidoreductase [Subtercola boreus]RFA09100.1 dehydrogenase [Subtercola boreus]TQL53893.1 3-oxoacyl-[acyl-carrier protein] reductase [Subtercola boreus]